MRSDGNSSQFGYSQPNAAAVGGLGWRFWMLIPPVGIGAGVGAGMLMWLLRAVQRLAWPDAENFLDQVRAASWPHRLLIVLMAGMLVALVRALLSLRPGGHGGELAAAIWFHAGRLPVWRTLIKAVTSIVIVGLGASLGREAAPKQVGALWAWLLSHWTGLPAPQRRLLSACGAGAGIAAVYNVPLGGALFALEVLLGTLALPLIPPALCTAGIATMTMWLFVPDEPTYHVGQQTMSPSLLGFAALLGPVAGLASCVYVRLIAWADRRQPKGVSGLVLPVLVFAVLGALSLPFPELLGNGKSEVQQLFTAKFELLPILVLVIVKPLATAACLCCGAPGGLFTPTITFGAALGGALAQGWNRLLPTADAGTAAILGAGAVLAAATAGPLSAIVLILELTRRIDDVMGPLVIAVAGAVATARLIELRSIYSARIHIQRATGSDGAISTAARLAEVSETLNRLPDKASLEVIDEEGRIVGLLDRYGLVTCTCHPAVIATARDCMQPVS